MTSQPYTVVLGANDRQATANSLARAQLATGMIPLVPGGGTDPWNHVEAAIALDLSGHHAQAQRAYAWLASMQRSDGAWYASYGSEGDAVASHADTNAVGYFATGLFAHGLLAGSFREVAEFLPVVAAGLDFVCRAELAHGMVSWSIEADGTASPYSLVAGSSSLVSSLRHGASLAAALGVHRPDWEWAAERVAAAVYKGHEGFFDKREFAMDWYYPVLAGALAGETARERLVHGAAEFVTENGVLCRSDQRWVTAAETAEAVIAAWRVGEAEMALRLFSTLSDKRRATGSYLTGLVYPERSEFPAGEETTYSSAAVLIAADVLAGGVANELFGGALMRSNGRYGTATSTRRLSVGEPAASIKRPDVIASR